MQETQALVTLALAEAVNRLADAIEQMAEAIDRPDLGAVVQR